MQAKSSTRQARWALLPILIFLSNTIVVADDEVSPPPEGPALVDESDGTLYVDIGVDIVSAYWWHGYLYENNGLIAQPYLEMGWNVSDGDDGPTIDVYFGWWNSLHSEQTDANESAAESWYETDIYGGVTLGFENFDLDFLYTFYLYPSDNDFHSVQEVGAILGWYPDTETPLGWILGEPTVGVFLETRRSNVGNEGDRASYAKIDFGPSLDCVPDKVTVSLPVSVGLSIEGFYEDESGNDEILGYTSIGIDLEIPLGEQAGADTTLNIGAVGLILSDNVSEVNETDDTEGYLYANISFAF